MIAAALVTSPWKGLALALAILGAGALVVALQVRG